MKPKLKPFSLRDNLSTRQLEELRDITTRLTALRRVMAPLIGRRTYILNSARPKTSPAQSRLF